MNSLPGVEAITGASFWVAQNCRVVAHGQASGVVSVVADAERYIYTRGFAFDNIRLIFDEIRLIAANWLSVSIVINGMALVLLGCILDICTSPLLGRLGRRS